MWNITTKGQVPLGWGTGQLISKWYVNADAQ